MPSPERHAQDRLRKQAEQKLQEQTKRLRHLSKQDMGYLIHELGTHQIELELQNEELRRAQEEREASHRKYADLYDFAPVGYFTLDRDGLIVEANTTGGDLLGRGKRSLVSRRFSEFVVVRDHGRFDAHLEEVFRTLTRRSCEVRLKRLRGGAFYAELQSIAVENHIEPPLYVRTAIIDITQRKKAEERIEREKELSDALNRINMLIFSTLNFDAVMRRVIEEAAKATGADVAAVYMPEDDLWVARYVYGLEGFEGTRVTADDIAYSVTAVRERRPVFVNTLPRSEGKGRILVEQNYGARAVLDAPLLAGDEVVGNLALYSCREGGVFEERHMDFIDKVSASVSLALRNATLFKALGDSENHYRALFNAIDEGFCIIEMIFDEHDTPIDYRFLEVNPSFEKQTGLINAQGKRMRELAPEHEEYWFETYGEIAVTGRSARFQNRAEQLQRWYDVYAFRFGQPENRRVAVLFNDITERKRLEEEIRHLAHHDALTGLPNRRLFIELLANERAQARRTQKKFAAVFLDLDRFKEVNDTLGHDIGDLLLKEVAGRLKTTLRASDTVARIGGDEFNLILADIVHPEDCTDIARKIVERFRQPFAVAGNELRITTSIGISIYPDDSEDIDTLLKYADMAMYHAKELGKNTYRFYDPDINVRSNELLRTEGLLRGAVERGELSVHYQPQVELGTRRIVSAEALVRWRHPERGLLEPGSFIPVAEESGLVTAIDEWVLRTVGGQMRAWLDAGMPSLCVTVNLSACRLRQPGLVAVIAKMLEETGMPPDCLDLEITESTAMSNIEQTSERLKELAAMGVRISVDDFGTGYSSLHHLKRLPIQRLKIDRSFVKDISTDPDDRAVIQAVTAMAHTMKMTVVAEGVETQEQLNFLHQSRCDEAQGYLFSRPLPAEEFAELIAGGA